MRDVHRVEPRDIRRDVSHKVVGHGRVGVNAERVQSQVLQVAGDTGVPALLPRRIVDLLSTELVDPMVAVVVLRPKVGVVVVDTQGKEGIALRRHEPPPRAVVLGAEEPRRLETLARPAAEAVEFGIHCLVLLPRESADPRA